jgi:hypothetical protein
VTNPAALRRGLVNPQTFTALVLRSDKREKNMAAKRSLLIERGLLIGGLVACVLLLALSVYLVCVCVFGALIFHGWLAAGEATKAADEFLALLGESKVAAAHQTAAARWRMGDPEESFAAEVKRLGLIDYASSSWPSCRLHNNVATLEGILITKAGGTIAVTMVLVEEGGVWRVQSVTGHEVKAGLDEGSSREP